MNKVSDEFENGSDRTYDSRYVPFIVKIICEQSKGHVFSLINFKLSRSDAFDKMSVKFETGSRGVKQ